MKPAAIAAPAMVEPDYSSPTYLFPALTPVRSVQEKPGELASIAHEIRNPLSTINLSAEMLKSVITDDEQKKFLDIIMRSSMRINDILTDLHSTFRANEMQVENYSIHELLDEVLAMNEDKIVLRHITVRKDYASEDSKIVFNKPKLKIALTNIIINAIDAMNAEKGELKLITRSTHHKCFVQVEDNGCGISKENLKNIFKPYFTNKPDGLGLGLATTYNILRSNHIRMNVESEEGKGTCFILAFEKRHP
jgi:signal transduction histidine kinase